MSKCIEYAKVMKSHLDKGHYVGLNSGPLTCLRVHSVHINDPIKDGLYKDNTNIVIRVIGGSDMRFYVREKNKKDFNIKFGLYPIFNEPNVGWFSDIVIFPCESRKIEL